MHQKALTDLASYMVEALRPLTEEERVHLLVAIQFHYCDKCGKVKLDGHCQ